DGPPPFGRRNSWSCAPPVMAVLHCTASSRRMKSRTLRLVHCVRSPTGDVMSIPSPEPNARPELRLDAEARLKENTAPSPKVWSTGANALSLLYTLASSPASADDALKLLHELQVHQVEL